MDKRILEIDTNSTEPLQIADPVKVECKRLDVGSYREFQAKIKEIENAKLDQ